MNQLSTINPATAALPQTYEAARTALAQCANIDECQDWADKAAALASYARQANDDQLERMSLRIKARAIRRAGELLKQVSGKGNNQYTEDGVGADTKLSQGALAEQAGLSKRQQVTAVRVANVPTETFEAEVEGGKPATVTRLAEMGKRSVPGPVIDLKGRDPQEFNRSMHFVAMIEYYAKELTAKDLDLILPGLNKSEIERARKAIGEIDAAHDVVMTGA